MQALITRMGCIFIRSSDNSIRIECVTMQQAVDGVQGYTDIVIKGKRHRIGG